VLLLELAVVDNAANMNVYIFYYLNIHSYVNRPLRYFTMGYVANDITVGTFDVEESNMPHSLWGLEGSNCCYISNGM
jgi:hypothetical protein